MSIHFLPKTQFKQNLPTIKLRKQNKFIKHKILKQGETITQPNYQDVFLQKVKL